MLVIGVDCATQPRKTGMVLASWDGGGPRLEDAALGSEEEPPLEIISSWIGRDKNVFLALDALSGGPNPLVPRSPRTKRDRSYRKRATDCSAALRTTGSKTASGSDPSTSGRIASRERPMRLSNCSMQSAEGQDIPFGSRGNRPPSEASALSRSTPRPRASRWE